MPTLTDTISTLAFTIRPTPLAPDIGATVTARLGSLQDIIDTAQAMIKAEARAAREARATWQQIGDALGITRQAAQIRYRS